MSGSSPRPQGDAGDAQQDNNNSNPQARVGESKVPRTEQELAQAFKELTRGEQTAAALEANLTSLEGKLDELLAALDASEPTDAAASASNGEKKKGRDEKP